MSTNDYKQQSLGAQHDPIRGYFLMEMVGEVPNVTTRGQPCCLDGLTFVKSILFTKDVNFYVSYMDVEQQQLR